jgi:hypothetical protein
VSGWGVMSAARLKQVGRKFQGADSTMAISNEETLADKSSQQSAASVPVVDLLHAVADPQLSENQALALLKSADLPAEVLQRLAKNHGALNSRKVRVALISHPHTPRHVSVPLARQCFTFDLMKVALAPGVPSDIKVAVEDVLIGRLTSITLGERMALARRASGRVAAALLRGRDDNAVESVHTSPPRENRVMRIVLENLRLTEGLLIEAVLQPASSAELIHAVAQHRKWSARRDVRIALLRTGHLSLARALEFSRDVPEPRLREVLDNSLLQPSIKQQLLRRNREGPAPAGPALTEPNLR